MAEDKIQGAIDVLVEQVDKLLSEAAEKKRVVNTLCNTIGVAPVYADVETSQVGGPRSIRPDQFFRKPFATAAQEFLVIRSGPCSVDEIVRGLEQGGFEFPWNEKDRARSVAISMSKNPVFSKVPNSNMFGLAEWYGGPKKRDEARRKGAKTENAASGVIDTAASAEKPTPEPDPDMDAG